MKRKSKIKNTIADGNCYQAADLTLPLRVEVRGDGRITWLILDPEMSIGSEVAIPIDPGVARHLLERALRPAEGDNAHAAANALCGRMLGAAYTSWVSNMFDHSDPSLPF